MEHIFDHLVEHLDLKIYKGQDFGGNRHPYYTYTPIKLCMKCYIYKTSHCHMFTDGIQAKHNWIT